MEYFVSYYDYYQPEAYVPQRDLFIEKDSAINEHIEQMRLSATKSVLERRDTIIVATVSAIYGIGAPEDYTQMRFIARIGDKMGQRDVIARLIRMQYSRNDADFSRGTFRVRGDVIDISTDDGVAIARGLSEYDAVDAARICGRRSGELEAILGTVPRSVLVHRDQLVLL